MAFKPFSMAEAAQGALAMTKLKASQMGSQRAARMNEIMQGSQSPVYDDYQLSEQEQFGDEQIPGLKRQTGSELDVDKYQKNLTSKGYLAEAAKVAKAKKEMKADERADLEWRQEQIGRALFFADTPEKFEQAKIALKKMGADVGDARFEDRDQYIAQAVNFKTLWESDNKTGSTATERAFTRRRKLLLKQRSAALDDEEKMQLKDDESFLTRPRITQTPDGIFGIPGYDLSQVPSEKEVKQKTKAELLVEKPTVSKAEINKATREILEGKKAKEAIQGILGGYFKDKKRPAAIQTTGLRGWIRRNIVEGAIPSIMGEKGGGPASEFATKMKNLESLLRVPLTGSGNTAVAEWERIEAIMSSGILDSAGQAESALNEILEILNGIEASNTALIEESKSKIVDEKDTFDFGGKTYEIIERRSDGSVRLRDPKTGKTGTYKK